MTDKEVNIVVESRIDSIRNTLLAKSKEYARGNDKLHNFNVGARIIDQSRERVLQGFMLKHIISIFDIINDIDNNKLPTIPLLEEKCGDAINYLILLEASIKEKISNQTKL